MPRINESSPSTTPNNDRNPISQRKSELAAGLAIAATAASLAVPSLAEAAGKNGSRHERQAARNSLIQKSANKLSTRLTRIFDNSQKFADPNTSAGITPSYLGGKIEHLSMTRVDSAPGMLGSFNAGADMRRGQDGSLNPRTVRGLQLSQDITSIDAKTYDQPVENKVELYSLTFSKDDKGNWKVKEQAMDPERGHVTTVIDTNTHFNARKLDRITHDAGLMIRHNLPDLSVTGGTPVRTSPTGGAEGPY